jgi:hypothetical protein
MTVAASATIGADPLPQEKWTLPKADAEKWVTRIRGLARDGWTVSVRGNDIVIQRDKPVRFAAIEINAPDRPRDRKPALHDGVVRWTLRFAPRMASDEYDRLSEVNAASDRERDRLKRAVGLTHKFDEFIATNAEEKARVAAYREAVAKLTWHTVPDLYTPEHSIFLFVTADQWSSYIYDKDVAAECQDVEETLLRYFGMYNPRAAAKGQRAGRLETPPRP